MSLESPNRSRSQTRPGGPVTVTPQHVTDPTILDNVAGFINDVVPTTHNGPFESKDQIQWARFEQVDSDIDYLLPSSEYENLIPSVIILVLGYTTGIQIWALPANGEATEILSWRHGSVKVLRILPAPRMVGSQKNLDIFTSKRPLIAICDNSTPGSQYNTLNFLSLKTGEQVKLIKFKNSILDVLANKQSVVVAFHEKIAVFDAFTLEDRLTVTTCYLSPGLQPNPIALGTRWLAYAEKKLHPSKRSSGGNDGEGVQSYTATVLHAAKSLGRGLRELGETVASSLTGNPNYKPGTSPNSPQAGGQLDVPQKGIVTIFDIKCPTVQDTEKPIQPDPVVAHFTAHTEAVVHLEFDPSGMLLLTADRRGHDFHVFRVQPHPGGPALAAVHHLYVLHRGDTSARVQHACFSADSRWLAVSTLRGTTHVFPVTPYGGHVGVRTHATPHVVNKMSRFHRSAGLAVDGRSNSPVSAPPEAPAGAHCHFPYDNPRFPPFPQPTVVQPLAQIRQPAYAQTVANGSQRTHAGRQRLTSSSEENIALRVVACFAQPRAWINSNQRDGPLATKQVRAVESLFIMSCHGTLVQYDFDPHQASNVPKEKVCNDTPIELSVSAKAQWIMQRQPSSADLPLPMSAEYRKFIGRDVQPAKSKRDHDDDRWLSQVEIVTHAGPHRRLWMGPQFTFKTYTTVSGSPMSVTEAQPIDLGQTKPVNMPVTKANAVLIESSSASSCEQSLLDTYRRTFEEVGGVGESQLKEDLADAMLESPGIRETGGRCVIVQMKPAVAKVVNPLGTVVNVHSDSDADTDLCQEEIIHENADEALFRPVVAPRAVPHHERAKRYGDSIITKSLESTTEVAVKILKKNERIHAPAKTEVKAEKIVPKQRDPSPVEVRARPKNAVMACVKTKSDRKQEVSAPKSKSKGSALVCVEEKQPNCFSIDVLSAVKTEARLPVLPPKSNNILTEDLTDFTFDLPPLESESSLLLENIMKPEKFEGAYESFSKSITKEKPVEDKHKEKPEEIQCNYLMGDLEVSESLYNRFKAKKSKKPKSKLGVKITKESDISNQSPNNAIAESCQILAGSSLSEELEEKKGKTAREHLPEMKKIGAPREPHFIVDPIISAIGWSIPEKKKQQKVKYEQVEKEQILIGYPDENQQEIENIFDNTPFEKLINFNKSSDKLSVESKLAGDDLTMHVTKEMDLIKIDKSSEDEKAESSSPAETTESDDSVKLINVEDSLIQESTVTTQNSSAKSWKKKKRKK